MRVPITILAALLLSCAGSTPPSTVTGAQPARVAPPRPARMGTPAGDRWRTAATEHFVLFSNGSDAQMKAVLVELERFRRVLFATMPDDAEVIDPPVPVTVFAVQSSDDLTVLAPDLGDDRTAKPAGACLTHSLGVDILIGLDSWEGAIEDAPRSVVRHEYHHAIMDRLSPQAPLWLREGLAEVWADARFTADTVTLGVVHDDHRMQALRHSGAAPISSLLTADQKSSEYRSEDRAGGFYSQSRLLAAYILLGGENGDAKLRAYLAEIGKGGKQEDAFASVFGPVATVDSSFRAFVTQASFPSVESKIPTDLPASVDASFAPVSEARILAYRGRQIAFGKYKGDAIAMVRRAYELDPKDAVALETAGWLQLHLTRDFGDAHGYFKAAAEQPDATAVAHFLAARTAYTDEDGRFVDPAYVKARVDRALELAPRFPAALGFRAVLLAKKDPKEAARLAERAALLSPAEPAYELRAGRVLARAGQRENGIQRIRSSIRRQLAIRDRTSESSAEMCLEGSLAGFAKEVAPLCDDAIALEPEGRRARLAAAQDVRWLLQNDYYVNRPYEYIWLEALENGAPATYETFRALGDPTWGL